MSIELVLFISITATAICGVSMWAFGHALHTHKKEILALRTRLNYLEGGMHHHGLLPLPWEVDDLESYFKKTKSFKQEGNIIYLQPEDKNFFEDHN